MPLNTDNYSFRIADNLLSVYKREEEEDESWQEHLLSMLPNEALALAQYIQTYRPELEKANTVLKEQFESDEKIILECFPKVWKNYYHEYPQMLQALYHTRIDLYNEGKISHYGRQYDELFWRSFLRKYGEQLCKEYLPHLCESEEK